MAKITNFDFRHYTLTTEYPESANLSVAADVLVIPLTHPMITKITGGDAEAWTLADGVPGQTVIINLGTDGGGTGTLTPATSTNWATIVFADAGDQARLGYVDDTIGWIVLNVIGLTAQPTVTV